MHLNAILPDLMYVATYSIVTESTRTEAKRLHNALCAAFDANATTKLSQLRREAENFLDTYRDAQKR